MRQSNRYCCYCMTFLSHRLRSNFTSLGSTAYAIIPLVVLILMTIMFAISMAVCMKIYVQASRDKILWYWSLVLGVN